MNAQFIRAGHAIFTVANPAGEYYTFRVVKAEGEKPLWFIGLLTGPDNGSDYTYLGILTSDGQVRLTKKSHYTEETKPVRVIRWLIGLLDNNRPLPDGYTLRHEGRCGRCGRRLTTPTSIAQGYGPECVTML